MFVGIATDRRQADELDNVIKFVHYCIEITMYLSLPIKNDENFMAYKIICLKK